MLHVYIADLTGLEDQYDEKFNMLHKSRADKLASYKMTVDKVRGLGAGLLLEKGLEDYLKTLYAEILSKDDSGQLQSVNVITLPKDNEGRYIIEYGYGPQGKPYLKDYPDVHFSLSHSGNLAVLAISDVEVGIDVQEHRGYNEKIAGRFYHEEEIKLLETVSDSVEREILFYKIWTCKEGYIKYTGKGMGQDLKSFYCNTHTGFIFENDKTAVKCMDVVIEQPDYQCCVVSGNNTQKIDKIVKIIL